MTKTRTRARTPGIEFLRSVFDKNGLFAKTLSGYELRKSQVKMAKAVSTAFDRREHLIVEAPCGVGKSFGYLVPALFHAKEEPIIVATANIALQEQLVYKDLPLLEKVLGKPISYALIKGKNNYLCTTRFNEWLEENEHRAMSLEEDTLIEWHASTETGDVTELGRILDKEPDSFLWRKVCGDRGECTSCKKSDCFAYKARQKARGAQVVICNYHVLFSHIELFRETNKHLILPGLSFVICDEAHEMADIAREFAKVTVSESNIKWIATKALEKVNLKLSGQLKTAAKQFFDDVRAYANSSAYKYLIHDPDFADPTDLLAALNTVVALWKTEEETLSRQSRSSDVKTARKAHVRGKTVARRARRAEKAALGLKTIVSLENDDYVYWIEGHERKGKKGKEPIKIHGKPKSVANYLNDHLFELTDSVVLTSATLTSNGDFDFVCGELGLDADELVVDTPFDFKRQALLVVPEFDTTPGQKKFIDELAEEVEYLLDDTQGRTLGLFTSYRNLNAIRGRLEGSKHHILVQGDKPRAVLLEEFLENKRSVLLGTKSFWQGVDVPGEALTCVFIDKLPFPPPTDPVIAAYEEDKTVNWFWDHSLPRAVIALKQGVGRLIRTKMDVGVVVVFDHRIVTKGYSSAFFKSLPDFRLSRDPEQIYSFLEKHGLVEPEE